MISFCIVVVRVLAGPGAGDLPQRFVEEFVQIIGADAELGGFDGKLPGKGAQAAKLFRLQQPRGQCRQIGDEGAAARDGADNPFALQIGEGAGHSIWIDAQLGSGAPRGGQRISGVKHARSDGLFDLLLDLQIHGDAGARGDVQRQHIVLIQ